MESALKLKAVWCCAVPLWALSCFASEAAFAGDACQGSRPSRAGAVWPNALKSPNSLPSGDVSAQVAKLHALMESAEEFFEAGHFELSAQVWKEIVPLSVSVAGENNWRTATAREHRRTAARLAVLPPAERDAFQKGRHYLKEANKLMTAGRYAEAEGKFAQASLKFDEVLGNNYLSLEARLSSGRCLLLLGRYQDMLPIDKKAYDDALKLYGEFHPDVAHALTDLAYAHSGTGRRDDADTAFEHGFGILAVIAGEDQTAQANARVNAARYFNDSRRYSAGEAAAEDALQRVPHAPDADSALVRANAQYQLAVSLASQGRTAHAKEVLQQALDKAAVRADEENFKEVVTATRELLKKLDASNATK